jgi:hypothetical protein
MASQISVGAILVDRVIVKDWFWHRLKIYHSRWRSITVESELLTSNLKLSVIRIRYEQLISRVKSIVNVLQSCDTLQTVLLLVCQTENRKSDRHCCASHRGEREWKSEVGKKMVEGLSLVKVNKRYDSSGALPLSYIRPCLSSLININKSITTHNDTSYIGYLNICTFPPYVNYPDKF